MDRSELVRDRVGLLGKWLETKIPEELDRVTTYERGGVWLVMEKSVDASLGEVDQFVC